MKSLKAWIIWSYHCNLWNSLLLAWLQGPLSVPPPRNYWEKGHFGKYFPLKICFAIFFCPNFFWPSKKGTSPPHSHRILEKKSGNLLKFLIYLINNRPNLHKMSNINQGFLSAESRESAFPATNFQKKSWGRTPRPPCRLYTPTSLGYTPKNQILAKALARTQPIYGRVTYSLWESGDVCECVVHCDDDARARSSQLCPHERIHQ